MPTSSHRGRLSAGTDIGAYFPDHPPTWLEVGLTLLVLGTVAGDFLTGSVSVPAAVAGFLLFAVVVGPGAASGAGKRVGRWFRGIGTAGRAVAIALFFVAVAVLSRFDWVPMATLSDAASGGLVAVALFVVVHAVRSGRVEGWTTGSAD